MVAETSAVVSAEGQTEELEKPASTVDEPDKKTKPQAAAKVPYGKLFSLATRYELLVMHMGNIAAFGNGLSNPLLTLFFGDMIDSLTEDTSDIMKPLREASVSMIVVGAMAAVCAAIQLGCFKYFAETQALRFREKYLSAVLHQDVAWFDKQEVASLATSMSAEAEKVLEAFGDKFGNSLMSWWAFIGGFLCAYYSGWQIALITTIMVPLTMIGAIAMGSTIEELQTETQSWYKKAATVVEECLFAFRTVVAFGGEKRELKSFQDAVEQTRKGGVKQGFKLGAGLGYTMMVEFLGYALAFYGGAILVYEGVDNPRTGEAWTPGTIMTVFFCVFIGSFFLGNINPGMVAMQTARVAFASFLDATDSPRTIEVRLKDTRDECPEILKMELAEVHFTYPARPDVPILKGLSLIINQGKKVAVVGESGSGKSTVMALLERFYDPDSGVVKVNDVDIKTFAVKSLRRRIGYVGQEPVLFATSVKENILQGSIGATQDDIDRVVEDAELSFVQALPEGLNTYVGSAGSQFSGGQKQRIAIAQALLKKTSVLFFDEATSALDNKSEKMILATIEKISAKAGGSLTIVSIAHRLSTVKDSSIIYVLSRGVVVESGTHEELVQLKGTYYALAATQQLSGGTDCDDDTKVEAYVSETQENAAKPEQQSTAQGPEFGRNVSGDQGMDEEAKEKARQDEIAKKYKVPMTRVLGYCKPEWPWMVPGILGAIVDGSSNPAAAWVLIQGLDAFTQDDKEAVRDDMQTICLIFLIIGVANLVAATIEHGSFAIVGEAMTKRLRIALLYQLFRQEVGFHDDPENTPAKLGKALELWAYRMSQMVRSFAGKAGAMASVLFGLVMAFVYSWHMALAMLGSIPIMIVTSSLQFMFAMGVTGQQSEGLQRAHQVLSDAAQNIRTCHASASEDEVFVLYRSLLRKAAEGSTRRIILSGMAFGLSTGTMFWILAGGFYFAGWLVVEGHADFIETMTAFMGIFYAAMGAGQATMTIGDAKKATVAAHDMFLLLDRQSKIDCWEPTGSTPSFSDVKSAGQIEFKDVRFRYPFRPDVEVLKGLSFEVAQGEAVGLVGPSGSGKSTVMALIQRFYDPDSGSLLIGPSRETLSSLNIRWWRKQLGFVGQEPILFNTTVRSNVAYGLSEGETPSEDWLQKCVQMSNLVFLDKEAEGLDTQVGPRGSRLSGGQKQRVAICRALVRNPPVLLLDEATSALDTQSEQVVQRALEVAREGRTSFSIAHRLSTIADCGLILVVSAGVMVEHGTHSELMDIGGVYQKLVAAASLQT